MRILARLVLSLSVVATAGTVAAVVAGSAPLAAPAMAPAVQSWAPAATAAIHPGVETFTAGAQCTANFVFSDGTNVYLGQAAHCAGTGGNTATDGCTSPSLPLDTPVTISGARYPGVLVYSSWLTMQALGYSDATHLDECQYNDLALVQIDPRDVGSVNPSVPFWGGPVGLDTTGTSSGEAVYSYGNSILRLGLTVLSPKEGTSLGDGGDGWTHEVQTVTPGVPGDSGSAFLDASGEALGVLSTLDVGVPGGLTNGVGDLAHELAFLHAYSPFSAVQLVDGTQPFDPNQVPLDTTQPLDPNALSNLQQFLGL